MKKAFCQDTKEGQERGICSIGTLRAMEGGTILRTIITIAVDMIQKRLSDFVKKCLTI